MNKNKLIELISSNLPLSEVEAYRSKQSISVEFNAGDYLISLDYELDVYMRVCNGDRSTPPSEMVDNIGCTLTGIDVWDKGELLDIIISDEIAAKIELLIIKSISLI